MSSYPGRGFVVGNGSSVSLPLVTGSRLRSVKIFFFVYNLFTFSPLLDFSVGLWLHVVDKAYM